MSPLPREADLRCKREPSIPRGWKPTFRPPQTGLGAALPQVVFKPDWKSHGKAAPFKRNDKMLEIQPQGLITTPESGITENIVDKARKLGIRVKRIGA